MELDVFSFPKFAHLRFARGMVYNMQHFGEVGESPP